MTAPYEDRLHRVLGYIHDNPAGDLSLDQLADVAAMSRFHWHRVFHAMTGETCAAAVRRIRLHRAACWLVQTDDSIPRVAAQAGFESVQSFGRNFRAAFGMTPGAFRKQGEVTAPLSLKSKQEFTMYNVELRHEAPKRIVGLPHAGPYLEVGRVFEQVSASFTARNLWPHARGMVGLYYDDPNAVAPEQLRSFGGVVVSEDLPLPDGLQEGHTTECETAILRYTGPYAGLKSAYDYLYGVWLPQSGREAADAPCYEVYLNSPADTAPEELITEICLPLS